MAVVPEPLNVVGVAPKQQHLAQGGGGLGCMHQNGTCRMQAWVVVTSWVACRHSATAQPPSPPPSRSPPPAHRHKMRFGICRRRARAPRTHPGASRTSCSVRCRQLNRSPARLGPGFGSARARGGGEGGGEAAVAAAAARVPAAARRAGSSGNLCPQQEVAQARAGATRWAGQQAEARGAAEPVAPPRHPPLTDQPTTSPPFIRFA